MTTDNNPLKSLLAFFADPDNHGRDIPEDVLQEAKEKWFEYRRRTLPTRDDLLLPPWITSPDTPRISMAWRMGAGESQLDEFAFWTSLFSDEEMGSYIEKYPENEEWVGFYAQNRRVVKASIDEWTAFGFYATDQANQKNGE